MGKDFILAFGAPAVPGFGAYAAILLTGDTEDVSPVRLGLAVLALALIWLGGTYLLVRRVYKRQIARNDWGNLGGTGGKGPDCDRCDEPTKKPFLYNQPRTHWRCEPCEKAVTDIMFTAAANSGLTKDMHR
ncbi:hypothetical protein [Streptomyces sp. NPDC055140]